MTYRNGKLYVTEAIVIHESLLNNLPLTVLARLLRELKDLYGQD